MELYPLDIVIHIINIVVLFILLRLIVFKPVKKFMDNRSERIQSQMDDAAALQKKADEDKRQYESRLTEASEKATLLIKDGERQAMEQADAITADAKKQAEQIIIDAEKQAEQERQLALGGLKDDVAKAAVEIAERILRREVKLEDNKAVVNQFFDEVGKQCGK